MIDDTYYPEKRFPIDYQKEELSLRGDVRIKIVNFIDSIRTVTWTRNAASAE